MKQYYHVQQVNISESAKEECVLNGLQNVAKKLCTSFHVLIYTCNDLFYLVALLSLLKGLNTFITHQRGTIKLQLYMHTAGGSIVHLCSSVKGKPVVLIFSLPQGKSIIESQIALFLSASLSIIS